MVYQAALAVVLHKLGGGADIAIGSPGRIAGRRDRPRTVIGPCANVVVLRNDLSGDPSLRGPWPRAAATRCWMRSRTRKFRSNAWWRRLNPPRSPSRNHPLFQSSIHFRGEDWALMPRDLTGAGKPRSFRCRWTSRRRCWI